MWPRLSDITTQRGKDAYLPWDNPDMLITLEQYRFTAFITNCVLSPIVFFIGTPTNLISCLVFYKQGMRDRMNLCLFVLALVDTAFIVSSFAVCLNSFVALWDEELSRKYYAEVLIDLCWLMFGSKAASGCISMVVSVEQCLCVVFPLKANSIMRTRTMGALLAAIVILTHLVSSIFNLTYRVNSVVDEASGQMFYVLVKTDFIREHHLFYDILFDIILSFSLPIVNIVVVGVATAITVIQLKTAIAWRASTSSGRRDNPSQQQQVALTKMLVILSCTFMASSIPLMSLGIVRLLVPDFSLDGRYSNFFYASHVVCVHFIAPLHSAVNFFVYFARSSRFRQELHTVFPCRVVRRDPNHLYSSKADRSLSTAESVFRVSV